MSRSTTLIVFACLIAAIAAQDHHSMGFEQDPSPPKPDTNQFAEATKGFPGMDPSMMSEILSKMSSTKISEVLSAVPPELISKIAGDGKGGNSIMDIVEAIGGPESDLGKIVEEFQNFNPEAIANHPSFQKFAESLDQMLEGAFKDL
uniref:STI1 domain-containing protein n=1 Tax=Spongospora subterranea TaxID=70186 RepID=A0A0H5R4L4_9EUKA|eukprot:CRZ08767.1 hypothetical protein [Spongospora subterranea]